MAGLIRTSLLLSAALALGRLLGFLREVLLAARLGASPEADVAVVVMTLPDFLVGLLLAGGFSAALIPALKQSPEGARDRLFAFVATWALLAAILVGAFLALFPALIFDLLAPGLTSGQTSPWLWALTVAGVSVPLAALSGVTGAWLNVRGIFFVVGLGTVIYNVVLCLALLPGGDATRILTTLTWGVLGAGLVRLLLVGIVGRPPLRPVLAPPAAADRRLAGLFAAGVLATGITFLASILFRSIAAAAGPGELAQFAYALRLFELPMGLVLTPITTVLLPRLSEVENPALVRRAFLILLAVSILVLLVGLGLGDRIARVIYLRGAMTEDALAGIVTTAKWMFAALPFTAAGLLGSTLLNARRRTGAFLQNAVIALLAGGGLAVLRPDLVLPAFVLFHATLSTLNLFRSEAIGMLRR